MQIGYIYFLLQTVSFINAGLMPAFYIPKSNNSWVKWSLIVWVTDWMSWYYSWTQTCVFSSENSIHAGSLLSSHYILLNLQNLQEWKDFLPYVGKWFSYHLVTCKLRNSCLSPLSRNKWQRRDTNHNKHPYLCLYVPDEAHTFKCTFQWVLTSIYTTTSIKT